MEKRFKTMKERPLSERPYEKCMENGPEMLSDGELLAVILRTGSRDCSALELAWKILDRHPARKGLAGLAHLSYDMLRQVPGIGRVKAVEILCVVELSRRLARASLPEEGEFDSPEYIAAYYMEQMRHLERERVLLLLLDGRHRLIREVLLAQGTEREAPISVRAIFQEAVRSEAVFLILMHNHPSGCPEPSREDLLLTRRIKETGELMGIPLVDHIIIGDQCFVSLKEREMM